MSKRLARFVRLLYKPNKKESVLESLYRTYKDWLITLAYRLTGNWDLAADVVHDVFTRLLGEEIDLESIRSPKNWLVKSVVNRALDYKRLAWYRLRGYLEDWERWRTVFYNDFEERDTLDQALKQLTRRERVVLVLRDVEGYSVKEIASMLSVSESTVRVLSKTGRDKFIILYQKRD